MNSSEDSLFLEAMVDVNIPWTKGLASMFYLVSPTESSYKTVEEVPQFYRKAWPYFLLFILLENVILWVERKPLMRVNDGLTSLAHALFQESGRLLFRGGESALYIYIYEHFHIIDLPWESPVTWYIAAIGVDFCYYWVHRASHEIHILWAQHQVHHSSEDYNLAVGLRQSVLQGWCGFIFYLPMAVFVPPAQFLTHQQFNLLYQFWIHTETVKSLGPLEWLLNTPKHHRVHHGSTLYCLDKNYGGFLIIWDRLFGTFQKEEEKKEIIYGLVKNQPSFNPLFLQVFYNMNVWNKMQSMAGWQNKLGAVIKGPSWLPGKPWTGADEDKIDVKSRVKYDVKLPLWLNVYIIVHFAAVTVGFQELALRYMSMGPLTVLFFASYIIGSLTVIGLLLEANSHAVMFEVTRCTALVLLLHQCAGALRDPIIAPALLQLFYITSASFWALRCLTGLKQIPHSQ
ncbi:alkylglycerol monooxygenase-like [Homalodisca vitripennis]|uniref:Alkylglycerol monooxygenase n=1 Tax=Homalodisca liturata TaxID=320908 RepID=A0A1B6HPR2_9HEMI|nr:alkylglycerol monooxygenase-like [Homalodisca vitripennis]XP_046682474.1 alkylglycerol monooxygenase-like [Homalodisca vitripennis]